MRRSIVIFSAIVVLALLAGIGYFGLGRRQPLNSTICETASGYDADSQPSTLHDVLLTAHEALDEIEGKVRDYSTVIVKTERIGNISATTALAH